MITQEERQTILDAEHLKLLSIGYYVLGGINLCLSLLGLLYVFFGAVMIGALGRHDHVSNGPDPRAIGVLFIVLGFLACALMVLGGALQIATGRCVRARRSPTFCRVIAALTCLSIPFGTLVGVFTFLVLGRASVEREFDRSAVRTTPPPL